MVPMGITAAICPPAPLLARELTGLDPVIPELRQACASAVDRLVRAEPDVMAVVGPGRRTAVWPADGRLDLAAFGPALGTGGGSITGRAITGVSIPGGPIPGGRFLRVDSRGADSGRVDSSGTAAAAAARAGRPPARRERVQRSATAAVGALRRAGRGLPAAGRGPAHSRQPGRVAGDGRRQRVPQPARTWLPGPASGGLRHRDRRRGAQRRPRPAAGHGLRSGARTARGRRPGWQVLAGAIPGRAPSTEVLYEADPFGVFYLVAWLAGG